MLCSMRPVDVQQNQKVHAKDFFEGLRSAAHEKRPAQERMLVPFIDFETHPGTGRSSPVRELHSAPKSKAKASLQPTKQKFGQANERPKQAPGKVPASQEKQRRPSPDSNGRTMPRRPTSPLPPTLPPLTPTQKSNQGRVTPVRAQPCKPGPAALAVKALQQQVLSNWAGPAFSLPPAPERLPMPSKALLGDRAGKGAASPTP